MASAAEILRSETMYPVPAAVLQGIAARRGIVLDAEATMETLSSRAFLLARADLLTWLSHAPDVSQGGQSYSFTADQLKLFAQLAESLYDDGGEGESALNTTIYGYKGHRL